MATIHPNSRLSELLKYFEPKPEEMLRIATFFGEKCHEWYGGSTTLNELRVCCCVALHQHLETPCGVSLIAEETGIPISTVSRAVTSLIENGSVVEEIYSEDRRRRLLRIGPGPNNSSMDDNVRTVIDYAISLRS